MSDSQPVTEEEYPPRICPDCDGRGYDEERVTLEMAIDAGDRSLEGQTMRAKCQLCEGSGFVY